MLSRTFFRRLPKDDKSYITEGAFTVAALSGFVGYLHYRKYLSKEFKLSEGQYRFSERLTNITPFAQSYYHWYRMPLEEYNAYYRFRGFYITGQLDTSKEILIPRKVDGAAGYDVLSPLYCYDGGKWSIKRRLQGEDPVVIDKSAVIVNRGWIPVS